MFRLVIVVPREQGDRIREGQFRSFGPRARDRPLPERHSTDDSVAAAAAANDDDHTVCVSVKLYRQ